MLTATMNDPTNDVIYQNADGEEFVSLHVNMDYNRTNDESMDQDDPSDSTYSGSTINSDDTSVPTRYRYTFSDEDEDDSIGSDPTASTLSMSDDDTSSYQPSPPTRPIIRPLDNWCHHCERPTSHSSISSDSSMEESFPPNP